MFGFGMPDVPEVTAEEVWNSIQKKGKMVLIDVRTPHEFSRGNIKGSINIPLDSITNRIEKELIDKSRTYFVYCLSGSRSVVAVDQMVKMGYKNVFSMQSGLLAWRAKGYPLTI